MPMRAGIRGEKNQIYQTPPEGRRACNRPMADGLDYHFPPGCPASVEMQGVRLA
jgi:hypothetical protein